MPVRLGVAAHFASTRSLLASTAERAAGTKARRASPSDGLQHHLRETPAEKQPTAARTRADLEEKERKRARRAGSAAGKRHHALPYQRGARSASQASSADPEPPARPTLPSWAASCAGCRRCPCRRRRSAGSPPRSCCRAALRSRPATRAPAAPRALPPPPSPCRGRHREAGPGAGAGGSGDTELGGLLGW